jgi:hypothetical protein
MIFIELGLVSRGARLRAATSATYYRPDSQLWDGAAITPGGRGRSPAHPVVPCFPLFVTRHCGRLLLPFPSISSSRSLYCTAALWQLLPSGNSSDAARLFGTTSASAWPEPHPLRGGGNLGSGRPARSSTCPTRQEGQKHADRGLRREGTLGAERLRHLTPCYATARYHVLIGRPENMFLTGTSQPRIAFLCGLRCHIEADISIVRQFPSCLSGPVVAHRSQVVTAALAFVKRRV